MFYRCAGSLIDGGADSPSARGPFGEWLRFHPQLSVSRHGIANESGRRMREGEWSTETGQGSEVSLRHSVILWHIYSFIAI
jgi:hypothetical protein